MNYRRIYNLIIEKYQALNLKKGGDLYLERHHIIPKCLGGLDSKSNLVNLPAREHFICHLLLAKEYSNTNASSKLWAAAHKFLYGNEQQKRIKFNSHTYSAIKKRYSESLSKSQCGCNNPNYGNKWTQEQKILLSKKKKGSPGWAKGRVVPDGVRRKISQALKGKPAPYNRRKRTEQEKLLISIRTREAMKRPEVVEKLKNRTEHGFKRGKENPMYGVKRDDFSKVVTENNKKKKGLHWYNNGIRNILSESCPEGYVKGLCKTGRFTKSN